MNICSLSVRLPELGVEFGAQGTEVAFYLYENVKLCYLCVRYLSLHSIVLLNRLDIYERQNKFMSLEFLVIES